jgi:hypothetical protein
LPISTSEAGKLPLQRTAITACQATASVLTGLAGRLLQAHGADRARARSLAPARSREKTRARFGLSADASLL